MKRIRKRLTYANIMASLAVFLVLGGAGALAASKSAVPKNSVGTKQLRKNAVSAEKIKPEAITKQKLRTGAVTAEKLANNSVTAAKIADGSIEASKIPDASVTASKLEPAQRSEAHAFTTASSFDLFDSYDPANWTQVMSLNLPEGSWVLTADVALSISSAVPTHVGCRMSQNGNVLAQGGAEAERVDASTPSINGVALSGLAGAGAVLVTCGDDRNGTTALNRSLIGRRVGSIGG